MESLVILFFLTVVERYFFKVEMNVSKNTSTFNENIKIQHANGRTMKN